MTKNIWDGQYVVTLYNEASNTDKTISSHWNAHLVVFACYTFTPLLMRKLLSIFKAGFNIDYIKNRTEWVLFCRPNMKMYFLDYKYLASEQIALKMCLEGWLNEAEWRIFVSINYGITD